MDIGAAFVKDYTAANRSRTKSANCTVVGVERGSNAKRAQRWRVSDRGLGPSREMLALRRDLMLVREIS